MAPQSASSILDREIANQTLHRTPGRDGVNATLGAGAGELV